MAKVTPVFTKSRWAKYKPNKFGAVRTSCGKHSHMSKAESECCSYLQLLERAGELKILKVQPNVILKEGRMRKRVIPDWLVENCKTGHQYYIDYKGYEGPSWRENKKWWRVCGPLPLEAWRRFGARFGAYEVIVQKTE